MDTNIFIISISALSIIVLVLAIMIFLLNRRISNILGNEGAKNLEQSVSALRTDLKDLVEFRKDAENVFENFENRINGSIRGIHTVRFNPFKGTGSGGNQSFATCLLNERGDGVIISSLYTRDHVSIFSKPINKYISEFELTDEEKESLQRAKEQTQKR